MKKVLKVAAAMVTALALTACSSSSPGTGPAAEDGGAVADTKAEQAADSETNDKTGETAAPARIALVLQQGGLGDKGYNDDGLAGLERLKSEYGIEYVTVEPTDLAQGETYLRELGEEGYDVIISIEYGIKDYMYQVAPDYPDSIFVIFGKYANGTDLVKSENVVELTFNYCEHSYLAGVSAAYLSKGNTIIDGVGQREGSNIAILCATESLGFYRYADGFMQGATDYDPDCNVYTDFTVGFTDTAMCKTIAENMITSKNCDVIWTCCGTAGLGGLQACTENDAFGIGVDCNQDYIEEGHTLTSVMRNTATSIYQIGTLYNEGKLKGAEINCNLANGILDITDMSTIGNYVTNQENFEELKALINQTRQDIIDGKINVYDCSESGVRFQDLEDGHSLNADYQFYGEQ